MSTTRAWTTTPSPTSWLGGTCAAPPTWWGWPASEQPPYRWSTRRRWPSGGPSPTLWSTATTRTPDSTSSTTGSSTSSRSWSARCYSGRRVRLGCSPAEGHVETDGSLRLRLADGIVHAVSAPGARFGRSDDGWRLVEGPAATTPAVDGDQTASRNLDGRPSGRNRNHRTGVVP